MYVHRVNLGLWYIVDSRISKIVVDFSKMLISYACVIICSGLGAFWREIDGSKLGVFWL